MIFEAVAHFHKAFGQLIATERAFPDAKIRTLRKRLLDEEYKELIVAERDDDIVEVADALTDITYILCGTAVSYGLTTLNWRPDDFENPEVPNPAFVDAETRNQMLDRMALFYETYNALEKHDDLVGVGKTIYAMINECATYATTYGFCLKDCFLAIHENNLSKLNPDGTCTRDEFGKVVKPATFVPVNLRKVLFPHEFA